MFTSVCLQSPVAGRDDGAKKMLCIDSAAILLGVKLVTLIKCSHKLTSKKIASHVYKAEMIKKSSTRKGK